MKNEQTVVSGGQYVSPAFKVTELLSEKGFAGSGAFGIKMIGKSL